MTVKLNESGYDTGMSFDKVCDQLDAAGLDSPRSLDYTEDQVIWYGYDYAKAIGDIEDGDGYPEDVPYWFVPAHLA